MSDWVRYCANCDYIMSHKDEACWNCGGTESILIDEEEGVDEQD